MRFPSPLQRTLFSCRAVLRVASQIVPRAQRADWLRVWETQVWHWCHFLAEHGQLTRDRELELARFCWTAFPDAFWRRFEREPFLRRMAKLRRSPAVCVAAIAGLVVIVTLTGGVIPEVRSLLSSPIPQRDRVCVISLNGKFRRVRSETLLDLASAWQRSKLLQSVAPYSWGPGQLMAPKRSVSVLSARVAPEFFQVLDLPATIGRTFRADDAQHCSNCIVLSHEIWQLQFDSDPGVIGRHVLLDHTERVIIGVLPRNFHLLAPEIAVWTLLDSGSPPFSNFVERIGAVARTNGKPTARRIEADLVDLTENAGYVFPASMLAVTSAPVEVRRYFETYLLFVLLAIAGAMLIVYARSGRALRRAPLRRRERWRWWSFFVAKSVLLLIATGLVAWSVVRWLSIWLYGSVLPMTNGVALWVFLILSVAPLSWAIRDQQRRCRVCLQRLGTPISIGAPGYVLLNWSGTEMVCPEGHGVLYLPDTEANWLEGDRWNNLDDSWADLFREE